MLHTPLWLPTIWALAQISTTFVLPQTPLPPTQEPLSPETVLFSSSSSSSSPLPLVIWHGLGDNYLASGLQSVADLANATNPGTYSYIIRLDPDPSADRTATFLGNLNLQVEQVCTDLASHPVLSTAPAINALGFSQGGQFLRAYIQRCNRPRVANLVTFGSQHNGIHEFQNCADADWLCKGWDGLLKGNTWSEFVQTRLVPAQYFRDAEQMEEYLEGSNFLADVNNEREEGRRNETYRENLKRLERFVMYVFRNDTTVIPKESGWFSEVNKTSGVETGLRERRMYKEDWLGLRDLDERGRLEMREVPGGHMQLSEEVLVDAFKIFRLEGEKSTDASVYGEL